MTPCDTEGMPINEYGLFGEFAHRFATNPRATSFASPDDDAPALSFAPPAGRDDGDRMPLDVPRDEGFGMGC
jgi:hypothetical protein